MKAIKYKGYKISELKDTKQIEGRRAVVPYIQDSKLYEVENLANPTDKTTVYDPTPEEDNIVPFLKKVADDSSPYADLWLIKKGD